MGERLKEVSGRLLGCRYVSSPLIGSALSPEVLTVSLEGFDCVTYIETVMALALARSVDDFVRGVRRLRYKAGRVEWSQRNHYMTDWIRNNVGAGFIWNLTRGKYAVEKGRALSLIKELPPKKARFKCFPKKNLPRIVDRLADGDLMFFVSTRQKLDVFHVGLVFHQNQHLVLRHASRSRQGVVEQPLEVFLEQNRMTGFILVRPRERSSAIKG
jgi:hypothetical protein